MLHAYVSAFSGRGRISGLPLRVKATIALKLAILHQLGCCGDAAFLRRQLDSAYQNGEGIVDRPLGVHAIHSVRLFRPFHIDISCEVGGWHLKQTTSA